MSESTKVSRSTREVAVPIVGSGSYPARSGNRIRPWIDGGPAFGRISEAIEAAQHSVWVTVTFLWADFEMPDGRGSVFDVLDRAAARGLDVRMLFWRPDPGTSSETTGGPTKPHTRNTFWGSPEQRASLDARHSGVLIRWDRAYPGFCQHQKSWLIDADHDSETAFVGGINLNPHSVVEPGHRGEGHNHDVYVEIAGPGTVDVHHNFVQRWNEASERDVADGRWGNGADQDLIFPHRVPSVRGPTQAQVQRTVHSGLYFDGHPSPGGDPFAIAAGERSILEQYRAAIGAARRSIYLENQYIEVAGIVACLHDALGRGVEVVVVLPGKPDLVGLRGSEDPERRSFLEARAALGGFDNFALCGLASAGESGQRHHVYVHAKLMIIDDEWATIGSCNLHRYSLFGNVEMNVSFWDPDVVRKLRCRLLEEHLGDSTESLDDRSALRRFSEVAGANRQRWDSGRTEWQGLAFSLDPTTYGC
jgi:cardiolipin synthase